MAANVSSNLTTVFPGTNPIVTVVKKDNENSQGMMVFSNNTGLQDKILPHNEAVESAKSLAQRHGFVFLPHLSDGEVNLCVTVKKAEDVNKFAIVILQPVQKEEDGVYNAGGVDQICWNDETYDTFEKAMEVAESFKESCNIACEPNFFIPRTPHSRTLSLSKK